MMKYILVLCVSLLIVNMPLKAQKKETAAEVEKEVIKVVIDAGHGGLDPGTEGSKADLKDEKDITLDIALKVEALLKEKYENIKVVQTRKRDITVSLEQRVAIANDTKGDYFVSIHCNSSTKKEIYGTQMHVHDFTYRKSTKLAQILDEEFTSRAKRNSKGLFNSKDRRFNLYVLRYTNMPGVLIETGFLSHRQEEEFLNSENGQEIVASAIFRGIRNFLTDSGHTLSEKETPKKEEEKKIASGKKSGKDSKETKGEKNASLVSYQKQRQTAGEMPPRAKLDAPDEKVVYKIQIYASPQKTPLSKAELKKLEMKITENKATDKKGDTTYKYTVGNVYTIEDALELMEYVRKKGFKDAFISKYGR
jgi:N-acetylmuramoyl-L-alanine amidase